MNEEHPDAGIARMMRRDAIDEMIIEHRKSGRIDDEFEIEMGLK